MLEMLKNGSGIHIKEKNKGSFTKWCNGKVTDECIRKGKNSPNPKIRKKATFADNARHFKHELGGILKAENGIKSKRAIKAGDLARMHLLKSKSPDWDSLDYGYNEMGKNGLSHPERVAIMGNTVQENAGSPKGHGIIQWIKNVPLGRDALWKSVIDSVINQANVYDRKTDSMLNWWGKYKDVNGRKAQELFRSPHTDIPGKTRIYSESYIRPGTPEINKRILYALQLDSIYNPNIKDNIVYYKRGGKGFIPGVSITDSNPKMYKYLKKKIKMNQYGGFIPKELDNSAYIQSSYMDVPFVIYGQTGNDYLEWKQKQDELKLKQELEKQSEDFERWSNFIGQAANLGINYLNTKSTPTTSTSATPSYFGDVKLKAQPLQSSFNVDYSNLFKFNQLSVPKVNYKL